MKVITATSFAIALGLGSTSAMAFVDYDHSAEGVKQSASMATSAPKSGGFVDYTHSAEGLRSGAPATTGKGIAASGGFVDWDHSADSIGSLSRVRRRKAEHPKAGPAPVAGPARRAGTMDQTKANAGKPLRPAAKTWPRRSATGDGVQTRLPRPLR